MTIRQTLTEAERATFPIGQAVRYKPGFGVYGFEDCLEDDGRLPGVVLGYTDTRVQIVMTLTKRGGRSRSSRCERGQPYSVMTHDYCEHCGACVPVNDLGEVRMMAATHLSPAETERWCTRCRQPEPEWDEHERDAARARGNDFARTGGKDWT